MRYELVDYNSPVISLLIKCWLVHMWNVSGMTNVKCHEKFKRCIQKVKKSGKMGFSMNCPYETAMPTMIQGMDMAILFSQLGNQKIEL